MSAGMPPSSGDIDPDAAAITAEEEAPSRHVTWTLPAGIPCATETPNEGCVNHWLASRPIERMAK
jgi:hypothetical protein